MLFEHKRVLANVLQNMTVQKQARLAEFLIKEGAIANADEVELDLDNMTNTVLWRIFWNVVPLTQRLDLNLDEVYRGKPLIDHGVVVPPDPPAFVAPKPAAVAPKPADSSSSDSSSSDSSSSDSSDSDDDVATAPPVQSTKTAVEPPVSEPFVLPPLVPASAPPSPPAAPAAVAPPAPPIVAAPVSPNLDAAGDAPEQIKQTPNIPPDSAAKKDSPVGVIPPDLWDKFAREVEAKQAREKAMNEERERAAELARQENEARLATQRAAAAEEAARAEAQRKAVADAEAERQAEKEKERAKMRAELEAVERTVHFNSDMSFEPV